MRRPVAAGSYCSTSRSARSKYAAASSNARSAIASWPARGVYVDRFLRADYCQLWVKWNVSAAAVRPDPPMSSSAVPTSAWSSPCAAVPSPAVSVCRMSVCENVYRPRRSGFSCTTPASVVLVQRREHLLRRCPRGASDDCVPPGVEVAAHDRPDVQDLVDRSGQSPEPQRG